MQEGYSTATPQVREMGFGAGMGLSNMKKNSDFMNITSVVGEGTVVELINYLKPDAREKSK
jgi:serine/threonine-protein kinase RsbT